MDIGSNEPPLAIFPHTIRADVSGSLGKRTPAGVSCLARVKKGQNGKLYVASTIMIGDY